MVKTLSWCLLLPLCMYYLQWCQGEGRIGLMMVSTKKDNSEDEASVEAVSSETEQLGEPFKPTNEWQTVNQGQAIPTGLHVRMNLQTGKTEAKLLDREDNEEEKANTAVEAVEDEDSESNEADASYDKAALKYWRTENGRRGVVNMNKDTFTHQQLKEALKKVKAEDEELKEKEATEKSYRSYSELKKDLEDLQVSVKSDVEIMTSLVKQYKSETDSDEKATILDELEYYVHQYDNAVDFVRLGGFSSIVMPSLNSSSSEVKSGAAYLLGSAMQSNPRVQIAGLEAGAIQQLLRLLAFDSSMVVRSRALYALSCMVRNFPIAQQRLIEQGGLKVFMDLFDKQGPEYSKLQLKVVTLLSDLVEEQHLTQSEVENEPDSGKEEKLRQYNKFKLEKVLVEQGWCKIIPTLLIAPRNDKRAQREDLSSALNPDIPVRPEHDVIEKVISVMLSLSESCSYIFQNYTDVLQTFYTKYKELSVKEELDHGPSPSNKLDYAEMHDFYYTRMSELINHLQKKINVRRKDEL